MRGELWVGWAGVCLLWGGGVEVRGQAAMRGELRWASGDVMGGEWLGVEEGWLRWKADELAEAVRVWLPRTVGWEVKGAGGAEAMRGEWSVTGGDGSFFGCDSWEAEAVGWTARTRLAGEVRLRREAVTEWRRTGKAGVLVHAGPAGMAGYVSENAGTVAGQCWGGEEGGVLGTRSIDQTIALPLPLPAKMRLDFWLGTDGAFPQFRLKIRRAGQGVEVETWLEELVGRGGRGPVRLATLFEKPMVLTVCVDFPGQEAVAFDGTGKEVGRWKVRGEVRKASAGGAPGGLFGALAGALAKGMVKSVERQREGEKEIGEGLILTNLGADLRLERLLVREWDGKAPMARPMQRAFVETVGGVVHEGAVTGERDGRVVVKGEGGEVEVPLAEVAWVRVAPLQGGAGEVKREAAPLEEGLVVRCVDGAWVRGRLLSANGEGLRVQTAMAVVPWEVRLAGVARLRWVVPEWVAGPVTGSAGHFDEWERDKRVTRGRWEPGAGAVPRWRVDGGDAAVSIGVSPFGVIRRGGGGIAKGVMLPGLAHLDSGEMVPAEVLSWRAKEVVLRSLISVDGQASRLPVEQVRALELPGDGLKPRGFEDPGWVVVRGGEKGVKLDRAAGKVVLAPGSMFGHGSFLQGRRLTFQVGSSESYGAIRVRLFADGLQEKSAHLALLIMRSGNTVYCGVEDPQRPGQIRGNTNRVPIEYEKPYVFSIGWSATKVETWVNGMPAMTHAVTEATRSGAGILLEPAGVWGNSVQEQVVSEVDLEAETGARARPVLDAETRTWALQVPRRLREDQPRHLLVARNGDVLRGTVEAMDTSRLTLRSGLEVLEVPRGRVALMVMPAGEVKPWVPAEPAKVAGSRMWLTTADGGQFQLGVTGLGPEWVEGVSPVLGACRVPAGQVREMTSESRGSRKGPFGAWAFVNAPDPELASAEEGAAASLKNQAVPGVDLELVAGGRFRLEAAKGRVVVLDFWATWCGPCLKAMPEVMAAVKAMPQDKVRLVGVNQGEAMDEVRAFLKARDWDLEVALDLDQKVGGLFGVKGIPHTVVVGPDGKVAWVSTGYTATMAKELTDVVRKLLP